MTDRCIIGLGHLPPGLRHCVLTIGNFEGVHLGHRQIVQTARLLANSERLPVVAMTFDPPPELAIRPMQEPRRIIPTDVKCKLLLAAGANYVAVAHAKPDLLSMNPEDFVESIIVKKLSAKSVVEGRDFHFGANRLGNIDLLGRLGHRHGFAVHVVEAVMLDLPLGRQRISSTLIRRLIAQGDVANARRCLGRCFTLYGCVVPGQGIGRLLEFPTANLGSTMQVTPADGVYAGWADIDGKSYRAAISIGNKLTLGPTQERYIEAFLLDTDKDVYGRPMELSFVSQLRDQKKFASEAELKAQIEKDVQIVRQICIADEQAHRQERQELE
jgi:riboflavin kinase/FMN adenylyltransferase